MSSPFGRPAQAWLPPAPQPPPQQAWQPPAQPAAWQQQPPGGLAQPAAWQAQPPGGQVPEQPGCGSLVQVVLGALGDFLKKKFGGK